ncbi:FAD-dependent oxidoreductase [Bordetella sp. 15P40C-2]|uniref:FAD-dependent oxidoreductase n=1 Tax=Bordetella sp. 15P40C-2 TaxID=2572246 RepID=UPI00132C5A01|nr:FAD-dependent oxidoreductase [Bordetella sp. 15P40C-2]
MANPLPERVDVAIIGDGIIGISTAWALAKAGAIVAVLEKGTVAGALMADLVLGNTPAVDPRPFRFSKYAGR